MHDRRSAPVAVPPRFRDRSHSTANVAHYVLNLFPDCATFQSIPFEFHSLCPLTTVDLLWADQFTGISDDLSSKPFCWICLDNITTGAGWVDGGNHPIDGSNQPQCKTASIPLQARTSTGVAPALQRPCTGFASNQPPSGVTAKSLHFRGEGFCAPARRERGADPLRAVTSEERGGCAKEPPPKGLR